RDLKPENAVISNRGVRLLDFGLAKQLRTRGPAITQIGAVVGTVHYIAPEQIRTGGVVDHRADVYSFGVIAFEMLTGAPPFVGERRAIEYQHQVSKPPALREQRDVPVELDQLVAACLAKQADGRPQSAAELLALLNSSLGAVGTIRGIGGAGIRSERKRLGNQVPVALAWIADCDPVSATRAAHAVHGIVVAHKGDAVLIAFTALDHEAPVAVALAACRDLVRGRCRIAIHLATALVRRPSHGRPMVYGPEVSRAERWTPATPFTGLVLTATAGEHVPDTTADPSLPGFVRERRASRTDVTYVQTAPLVGRASLLETIVRAGSVVAITGEPGIGKTRVWTDAIDTLRGAGRTIVAVCARQRFPGERPDDGRLLEQLEGTTAAQGLAAAAARGVVIAIDDADRLSSPLRRLLASTAPGIRILTSTAPLFQVADGEPRIAIALPALALVDAQRLLRDQLEPARLIPDVLIERLALRGAGNPGLLLALARDIKRRGAIRRHAGSDEWYVAADELDTLLTPPGPAWLAHRALEDLASELTIVARMTAALGPRFCASEVAAVTGASDAERRLAWLVSAGLLDERGSWFGFADPALQAAIYDHELDERTLVHHRALAFWLAHDSPNAIARIARVAHHAAGAGDAATAAACTLTLAREAMRRSDPEELERLLAGAARVLAPHTAAAIRAALV
ncbi:MAG: protein kinase, partial [Kofleriaceae bacterium]